MKILVCGDSYCVTDPAFPDLHWSEKILNHSLEYEVCNLAYGGCSNALIALQLTQGLQLDPDFVILSFTNEGRYELDNDLTAIPSSLSSAELSDYLKRRYITNNYPIDENKLDIINRYKTLASSENFEKLKNYFYICFCLLTLQTRKIDFCFTLGGFEFQQDYTAFLNLNFTENLLREFVKSELRTNLWYYGRSLVPYFHVDDDKVQTLFANECISKITASSKKDY
jgi:hypothetical protein